MEQITDVKTTEMNLMPSAGSKTLLVESNSFFPDGTVYYAFGACTDDYHGTCHE